MPVRAPTSAPQTLTELAVRSAEHFGERPAQRVRGDGGGWHDVTYGALLFAATQIARGLVHRGVQPGDRVAILSSTRPEWVQAELGIVAAGAVVVPIYPSSSPDECAWVLGDSGAVVVVCEDAAQLEKVQQVQTMLPDLQAVLAIDPTAGVPTLDDLRDEGRAVDTAEVAVRRDAVRPDDPALIIYTSGTTGRPKGCVLTHRNLTACCRVTEELQVITGDDVTYLFLPLAHVFAQVVQLSVAAVGGVVAYCSGDMTAILSDCAEVRPTCLPAVPRIFEKVYASIAGQVPDATLERAVDVAQEARALAADGQPLPGELQRGFERVDAQLFARVRGILGGRVRVAITGAAPIAPEILRFFHAAGVPVYEGYGLSESASVGTLNSPGAVRIGSIGRPVPGCELRIADDGEILMRGPHVFAGYHDDEDATAAMLVDGWLHTGDLGAVDDDGYVTISGRKKDIIITAGGKNIAPANLENDLRQSPWISQVVMYGDRRPYPVAIITLDADHVLPWAEARGLEPDLARLATLAEVRQHVQQAVGAANARYATATQIKRFAILDHDLTAETGALTPTLKVRRRVVHDLYGDVLESLYAESGVS